MSGKRNQSLLSGTCFPGGEYASLRLRIDKVSDGGRGGGTGTSTEVGSMPNAFAVGGALPPA